MLAYVFWHHRRPDVGDDAYEAALLRFHDVLSGHAPAGFTGSTVFRLPSAPWLATSQPVYEDWYYVKDFAALDALNEAAVSAARQGPHDAVAAHAAAGKAGLYGLRSGPLVDTDVQHVYWFGKPEGSSYEAFYGTIEPVAEDVRGALWGRQMVLGPTPEFCLQAPAAVDLPPTLVAQHLTAARIWNGVAH